MAEQGSEKAAENKRTTFYVVAISIIFLFGLFIAQSIFGIKQVRKEKLGLSMKDTETK